MKRCSKCGSSKELSEFNKNKSKKDGHQCYCRICADRLSIKRHRDVYGGLPMEDNKSCPVYLGVAVAERLVRHLFKDVVIMPYGNPGFDFICAKDKKIDVKSACITMNHKKNSRWRYTIKQNKIADYFLLLAFNNRIDLEPVHQWLIPAKVLNHLLITGISMSTLNKWDAYQQDIETAQICCNTIKHI